MAGGVRNITVLTPAGLWQERKVNNGWHCCLNRIRVHPESMRHREGGVGDREDFKLIKNKDTRGLHNKHELNLETQVVTQ